MEILNNARLPLHYNNIWGADQKHFYCCDAVIGGAATGGTSMYGLKWSNCKILYFAALIFGKWIFNPKSIFGNIIFCANIGREGIGLMFKNTYIDYRRLNRVATGAEHAATRNFVRHLFTFFYVVHVDDLKDGDLKNLKNALSNKYFLS